MHEAIRSRDETRRAIQEIFLGHMESPLSAEEMHDDVPLGNGGLGLDSIAVVEALLECEERWDISPKRLIEGRGLLLGNVVDHFTPA